MTPSTHDPERSESREFQNMAEGQKQGFLREFGYYLKTSKKWWLTPIIVTLVLIGGLLILSTTVAGPFIYTLF